MDDPIRLSGDSDAPETLNSPVQKWLAGDWYIFEIKFSTPDEPAPQTTHEFGSSLDDVVKRYRDQWAGLRTLESISRVDDLRKAGLLRRDLGYVMSSVRAHGQFLVAKAADLRLRVTSAYSCLRDGVSI